MQMCAVRRSAATLSGGVACRGALEEELGAGGRIVGGVGESWAELWWRRAELVASVVS